MIQLASGIRMAETPEEEVKSMFKGTLSKVPGLFLLTDVHKNHSNLVKPAFSAF